MKPAVFLNSLINYEKVPGYEYDLAAYGKFLQEVGSPHKKLKNVILIAGTKGKGSTAAIISSCLIARGFKVGLYTSPHLNRINERIRINNREISNQELAKFIRIIKPYINLKTRIGARTFFEVLTAIAFLHFARNGVDFAVLEVGLGGRLDATNVADPLISVITRVGYDHMNMLGNKLEQIAYEKAGIIRRYRTAVVGFEKRHDCVRRLLSTTDDKRYTNRFSKPKNEIRDRSGGGLTITIRQRPSVEKILKRTASQRGNRLIFAESSHRVMIEEMSLKGSLVRILGELGRFRTFLPLVGRHQVENLKIALAVLNELKKIGLKLSYKAVKRGIKQVKLPGRFEVISRKPLVIYDVAHNEDSFRALEQNIKLLYKSCHCEESARFYGGRRSNLDGSTKHGITRLSSAARNDGLYLIFGCSQDKDISYAIKRIFPLADEVLLVRADHPRALEPMEICRSAREYQKNIIIAGSCRRALEYLRTKKEKGPAIIVFGSFYLWNEMMGIRYIP